MPRRLISDSVLSNPILCSMPVAARYLWVALLVDSDDHGRVCVDPSYLLGRCFVGASKSLRRDVVGSWISRWESVDMLSTYQFAGLKYAKLTNFEKHQRLKNPRKSTRTEQTEGNGREQNRTEQDGGTSSVAPKPPPAPILPSTPGGDAPGAVDLSREIRWRWFRTLADGQATIKTPGAYVASKRKDFDDPAEVGVSWWVEPADRPDATELRRLVMSYATQKS